MSSAAASAEATRFGKYGLVARLATGGMAEIFLARLTGAAGFEKLVCIKRILPHLARDKQFVAMFLDEARIAARISHPNVCQVFELGEIDGSYYIAMEYLEGVPLACFRRADYYGAMPAPRLVAGIAVQACEGLHHAHQLKKSDGSVLEVVHRDISPQNLFVTVDGVVKVLDFGIAKIQDATVRTSTGAVKGTYAYMAPEQLRGERVDRRTDVFALGIVMWETLMRRHLFRRETDFLTFQAITTDPIEDVRAARPDVPEALAQVIMTALSRDREQRYPTARALGEAIANAVPPLAGSAISEEIARAFPAEIGEQAALIRTAREGGAFDLNIERGPRLGQETSLATTPTSNLHHVLSEVSGIGGVPLTQARTVASGQMPIVQPPPSGQYLAPGAGYGSQQMAVPSLTANRWRPIAIAAIALALGGGGALIYAQVTKAPAPPAPPPVAHVTEPPVVTPMPAPPVPTPVPVPVPVPAPSAPTVAPTPATPRPTSPDKRPPPASADKHTSSPATITNKSSGPPGYITIDSAPVYATIFIDGKNYGETPLVKLSLTPGRHNVHAVAPSGASRDVHIMIESGKTAPASRIEW